MNSTEIIVLNILDQHRGKANAIRYHELADTVGLKQRELRKLIQGLIRSHRIAICTSYDKGCGGYYLPKSAREVRETSHKLRQHGINILARAAALEKITLPELLGQLQLEM